jgi:DNA-binding IclR family transcriptional regulator
MTDEEPESVKGTIVRCIRVLERLAEADSPISVTKLAAQLGLAPSTTHRILGQLRNEGIVSHDRASAAYRPGPELIRIAALVVSHTPFQRAYVQSLETLTAASEETSFLAIYLPASRQMRFSHVVPTRQPIQYVMEQSRAVSVLFGASGRVIAAYLPEDTLREIYDVEVGNREAATMLPGFEEFLRQLADIREAGHAISSGQRVRGAHAIVAPVFAQGHQIMGSVGISMPVLRAGRDKDTMLVAMVKAEASRLSILLGDTGVA